jgi:hypothetical protein
MRKKNSPTSKSISPENAAADRKLPEREGAAIRAFLDHKSNNPAPSIKRPPEKDGPLQSADLVDPIGRALLMGILGQLCQLASGEEKLDLTIIEEGGVPCLWCR